jgi:RNA polymerase-binding transcription factor DksA
VTLNPEERDALQGLLASEKERTAATEEALVAELEAIIEASAQSNSDDEHDPEGATVGFERARVASQLDAARRRLSELDEAAERLGTDAFGTCRRCGKPIAFERLAAHPTAVTCVACADTPARPALRRRAGP